jgi:hypothetical protein
MLETMFLTAQAVQLVGWAALFAYPLIGRRRAVLVARAVTALLALLYLCWFLPYAAAIPRDMGYSLAAIAGAFETRELLLAGWIHYLVLDLFLGSWEAEHAERWGVSYPPLASSLFLTMMAGPLGLLVYFACAGLARRRRKASA